MSKLSRNLNEEVSIDIYKKTLMRSRLLKENFSDFTINSLSLKMKERKCIPEETIYNSGDIADKLLFVLSGELELYANKCDQVKLK
jgi:CRP-like cAMP-binding protein